MKKKVARKKAVTAVIKREPVDAPIEIIGNLVLENDLSTMKTADRVKYYMNLCKSMKLNPMTKPFDLIKLNNKLTMYANKNCAEQLRQNHNVSVIDQKTEKIDDVVLTTVKVQNGSGRTDTGTGAVNVKGKSGDDLANAIMKSETKAKRRATLSICGLGMSDETELETIPNVQHFDFNINTGAAKEKIPTGPDVNEMKEKLSALPEDIAQGFRILGYTVNNVVAFCTKFAWDHNKIKYELNKIADANDTEKIKNV
jgi:hypothetical protein